MAKMQLADVREAYEECSGKVSEIVRQLSLAGVALIWVFKAGSDAAPILDKLLVNAALFIFLALIFDLLQYFVSTVTWISYFRYKEIKGTSETDSFEAPPSLNWPTWALFFLKCAMLFWAYAHYILPFLRQKFGA